MSIPDVANTGIPSPLGASGVVRIGNIDATARLIFTGNGFDSTNRPLLLTDSGGRIVVQQAGATLAWSGPIDGGASAPLNKDGAGTLRLSGVNGYTGSTNINAGKLQVIGSNALANAGKVTVAAGATFELLAGTNETIGSLEGAGSVILGGQRLTAGGADASTTYSGAISGTGASQLEKQGGGTYTLTNPDSSFTGGVLISDGAVSVSLVADIGTNSPLGSNGPIMLGDEAHTGRLIFTGAGASSMNRSFDVSPGGGVIEVSKDTAELTLTGPVAGPGTLLKIGAGRLRLLGDKADTDELVVADGVLRIEGHLTGSGVTVIAPGTLDSAGSSTIDALNVAGGRVAPGGSGIAGALAIANLTLSSGVLALDLRSGSTSGYDHLDAVLAVTLDGPVALALQLDYDPEDYVDVLRIIGNDGTGPTIRSGADARFTYGANVLEEGEIFLVSSGAFSQQFEMRYGLDGVDNDVRLVAVPEPRVAGLAALAGLGVLARRRNFPRDKQAVS